MQKWEDRTVRLLIENYVHFKHLFKKGKTTKKDVFQKIADRFNETSTVKVSGDQCMRKWLKLEAKYKEIEDNNNLTGRTKKSWKFYEDLDMLEEATGDSPKVNPAYTYGVADGTPRSSLRGTF